MTFYNENFLRELVKKSKKENARYVVFDDENLDILGTAKSITQVKKIARKYLEECEEAIIMYYDKNEHYIFFLECC